MNCLPEDNSCKMDPWCWSLKSVSKLDIPLRWAAGGSFSSICHRLLCLEVHQEILETCLALKRLTGVRESDEQMRSISTSTGCGTCLTGDSLTAEVLQKKKTMLSECLAVNEKSHHHTLIIQNKLLLPWVNKKEFSFKDNQLTQRDLERLFSLVEFCKQIK